MLKESILRFLSRKNINKRSSNQATAYDNSKCIGIIVNLKECEAESFSDLSDEFIHDGKEIKFVGVCNDIKKRVTLKSANVFSYASIGILGQVKQEALSAFLQHQFDFLIVIDHINDQVIRYIASKCNAGYIVGVQQGQNDLYDLQLKAESAIEKKEIIRYIKKIK